MIVPNSHQRTSPLIDAFLDRLSKQDMTSQQPTTAAPLPVPPPQDNFLSMLDRVFGMKPTRPSMNDTIGDLSSCKPSEIKLVGPRSIHPEFLKGK